MSAAASWLHRGAYGMLLLLALTVAFDATWWQSGVADSPWSIVRVELAGCLGLWLLSCVAARRMPRLPRSVVVPGAVCLTVLLVAALAAPSYRPEALKSWARMAAGVALGLAAFDIARGSARRHMAGRALALAGVSVTLLGLAEAANIAPVVAWLETFRYGPMPPGDLPRVSSTLPHPNIAAMMLELTLPLVLAWALTSRPGWSRWVLGSAFLAGIGVLVLTFSRAGLVAFMVGVVVMAVGADAGQRWWSRPFGGLTVAASGLALLAILAAVSPTVRDRWAIPTAVSLVTDLKGSIPASDRQIAPHMARLAAWSAAEQMLIDRPLLGMGPDNFRWRFRDYSGIDLSTIGTHAHNIYLEWLADCGMLGFVALIWFSVRLVSVGLSRLDRTRTAPHGEDASAAPGDRLWALAFAAALVAWFVHGLLDDFYRYTPTLVAFWLIAGLAISSAVERAARGRPARGMRVTRRAPAYAASVVVPTRGDRPEQVRRVIEAILANDFPPFEVVVVDQGAAEESARLVEQFAVRDPRVRLVRTTIMGVAHARNLGVAETSAPIIAFTDDDCEPAADWLRGLIEPFQETPRMGIAFGSVVAGVYDPSLGFIMGYRPRQCLHLSGRLAKLRDAGIGGNMAVRRVAFSEVSGFDEMLGYGGYFPSMEDQDMTYRMLSAGFELAHVPHATVVHHGPHDWSSGRPLIRGTYVAIGATYTKYVRLGDWVAVLLLLHELGLATANLAVHLLRRRRPFGFGRLGGLLQGIGRSFELGLGETRGHFAARF